MAELVDALVSGTSAARRGGSRPLLGTITHFCLCFPLRFYLPWEIRLPAATAQVHREGWDFRRRTSLIIALKRSPCEPLKLHIARHQAYPPTRVNATNTTADANVSVKVGLEQRTSLGQTPSCL